MKTVFGAFVLFAVVTTTSQAAEKPKVTCELTVIKRDEKGVTKNIKVAQAVVISQEKREAAVVEGAFTLVANLRPITRSDGNVTGVESLSVEIKKGSSATYMNTTLNGAEKHRRLSTALTVGAQQGFVNCDQESL